MRGRSGTIPGRGTIISYSVNAPTLAFGSLPGKLFTPSTATYDTNLGLHIYMCADVGTANDVFNGPTKTAQIATYITANPTLIPFYVWAPQLPAGGSNDYTEVWKAIVRGIAQLHSTYRINMRKITFSGFSAGASFMGRCMYSFPWLAAGFIPMDCNINRNNLTSTASMNGESASGFIMDPAAVADNTACFTLYATRILASGMRVCFNYGDASDNGGVNDMSGLFTALTNQGATVVTTSSATYAATDSYVQIIGVGQSHASEEGYPWTGAQATKTIAWIDNCVRPDVAPSPQPFVYP